MAWAKRGLFLSGLTVGALAALWTYGRWLIRQCETVEPEEVREPEETLYIDGSGIHYVDRGQGPPLVLIHGLAGSAANFQAIIPLLAQRFRVVAPDLLGFGLSDRPPDGDYSQRAQARLLRDFMERLGILKASLLGHSLGGVVALRFASLFPERVDRLILVCSAPPVPLSSPLLAWPPLRPLLEAVMGLALHARRFREGILRQGFWDPSFLTAELAERYLSPSRLRGSARALAKTIADIGGEEPIALSQVRHPTLLLWGVDDRWLPPSVGERMAASLANAHLRVIARSRHLLLEERPQAAAEAISSFLLEPEQVSTARQERPGKDPS